jgi:hypothetical protein
MRYLVVVPPNRLFDDARFHDVDAEAITIGDELLLDEALLVRVQSVVDIPSEDGYDATLVCFACD